MAEDHERRVALRRNADRLALTESELDRLATVIGDRIEQKIYAEIGRVGFRATVYCIGALVASVFGWAHLSDKVNFGELLLSLMK